LIGTGAGWERFGQRFFPGLGGVHLVEATKSLYAPVGPAPARKGVPVRLNPLGSE